MAEKLMFWSVVENSVKLLGLVTVLNAALIVLTDPAKPLGNAVRGTWTFFFETFEDCYEAAGGDLQRRVECEEQYLRH